MSVWPDMTVGISMGPLTGSRMFGLSWVNSGSTNRLSGLWSTPLSQPIGGGGLIGQPSFSKA